MKYLCKVYSYSLQNFKLSILHVTCTNNYIEFENLVNKQFGPDWDHYEVYDIFKDQKRATIYNV